MYDHPYVYTNLNSTNTGFKLCVRLIMRDFPVFELIIDNDGRQVEASGAFNCTVISIKSANGTITKIPIEPNDVSAGRIYLYGTDGGTFARLIDKGNCKIIVQTVTYFDDYNNPGKYIFSSTNETKGILNIISDKWGYLL